MLPAGFQWIPRSQYAQGELALTVDGRWAAQLMRKVDGVRWVPTMLAETDEASQMDAFAGRADMITDYAGQDDQTYVWARLQKILVANCLVPAEEGPCA